MWVEMLLMSQWWRLKRLSASSALGARVGLLSQQTVSKSQGNGKRTQPITHLASTKQIYNLLNQFLCSLLSSVCTQFVCSLLGHVTTVSPLGKPQKNLQFTEQIYLKFTEPLVQSVLFQFAEWFNHSLLDPVNWKKNLNGLLMMSLIGQFEKYLKFSQDMSLMVNYKFSFSKLQIHVK